MAEESTGIKYTIDLDDTRLRQEAERAVKEFNDISKSAKDSGNAIDSAFKGYASTEEEAVDGFKDLNEQIAFQKDIIKGLEEDVKAYEKALAGAAPGNAWIDANEKLRAAKKELAGEKKALEELQGKLNEASEGHVKLRTQISSAREELARMENDGKRGTQEYEDQKQKLQELAAMYKHTRMVMREQGTSLQGVISMLSGLSGAFSAVQGVVGMFTKDNEKLQQAMLKVQSLMSITIGLQQIQQTLNKDSAFRLVIINGLKDWWTKATVKATEAMVAEAAATRAAGVAANTSAGFFKTLGVALKSLSAGAITAILAALTAIAVIVAKVIKGEKQISGEMKRQQEYIKGVRESRLEAQKATMKDVIAMEQSVSRLRQLKSGTSEYERTLKGISDQLGVQYGWLDKNTGMVKDLAKAWMDVKIAQAMGDAYLNKASSVRTDTLDAITKLQNLKNSGDARGILDSLGFVDPKWIDNYVKLVHNFRASGGAAYGLTDKQVYAMIKSMESELVDMADEQAQLYIREFNKEVAKQSKAMKPITDAQNDAERQRKAEEDAKKAADTYKQQYEDAKKAVAEGEKNLAMYMDDLRRKYLENDIAAEEDSSKRRIREIEDEKNQELQALDDFSNKVLEEQRKIAKNNAFLAGKQYDEESVKLPEGFDAMIDNIRKQIENRAKAEIKAVTDETKKAYEELAAQYANFEGKIKAIKDKYNEQLKTAGGDEALKSNIKAAQRREIAALVMDAFKAEEGVGRLAGQIDSLGKSARGAVIDKLQKILQFAQGNKGIVSKDDIYAFAELNGISGQLLESLMTNDEALEQFAQYLKEIGDKEPITSLTDAVKRYRKALEEAKSGKILDTDALEKAKEMMNAMVKELADNVLDELSSIGDALEQIGEMVGNKDLQLAGEALNDVVSNIKAAEQGAEAWGGWWGAIIGGLTDLLPKIVKWVNKGTERSLEDTERSLEDTEKMLSYWKEIYKNSNWTANDYTQAFDSEEVQALIDKIKDARRYINANIAALAGTVLSGNVLALQDVQAKIEEIKKGSKDITEYVGQIMDEIADGVSVTAEEAYGKMMDAYDSKLDELQAKLEKLLRYPKKNKDEIENTLIEIAEVAQEKLDEILAHAESIVGVTSDQLFSDMYGMISAAFDAGKDSVDDFEAYYNRMVRNMIKTNVMKQVLESLLSKDIELMANSITAYQRGEITQEDLIMQLQAIGEGMQNVANNTLDTMRGVWQNVLDLFPDMDEVTAASRGVAAASQDSIDELNGRMTVIQAHTTELVSSSALNAANTGGILAVVEAIKGDTASMRKSLNRIEAAVAGSGQDTYSAAV